MKELIEKAKEGHEQSFNQLYKLYNKEIYYVVYNIVKDNDVANDLVSEIFIKVYQNISMYREDISFRMWLKTIANNYTIDYLRKKKRDNTVSLDDYSMSVENSTEETPMTKMIDDENIKIMYHSINQLKEPYRSIINMRLEGKKYTDIADELDINLGTLKAYIAFAKKKLKKFSKKCE